MFRATANQLTALEKQTFVNDRNRISTLKEEFVIDFLDFSREVTPADNGYGAYGGCDTVGKLRMWKSARRSNVVEVGTQEGSPAMAAEIVGFSSGVSKRFFNAGRRVIQSVLTAADVNVGVMAESHFGPRLLAANVVLRVTLDPPAVYYDPEGLALKSIEPETPEWPEMAGFAHSLMDKALELSDQ